MPIKIPRELSLGEETFELHCRIKMLKPEREYQFCERGWKFDFCWPFLKLAVEIEGGTKFGKSRHSQGDGFEKDCIKYNAATLLGWKVLRYSTKMVQNETAINQVVEYLESVN